MKKYIGNLLLVVFSTLFIFGLLEVFTRLAFKNEPQSDYQHRVSQPEPYQDSDYFSKEFIEESLLDQRHAWITPEGTRILYPVNYAGKYFNVKDNLRFTTHCPDTFANDIHLFGGSTIYNQEVPDQHTVASYLQRSINEKWPSTYRVLNYGAISINTSQQLERLKTIDVQAGDLVIFYGGVNDALLFTTGRIDGWIVGENTVAYNSQLNLLQKLRFKIHRKLNRYSRFVDKFLNPFAYQVPAHLTDNAKLEQMKIDLKKSYAGIVTNADEYSRERGATFYNFLQPTILSRSNRTPYEEELLKNKFLITESWLIAVKNSYTVLREVNSELQEKGLHSKDISTAFDQSNDSHYLDICHITDKGNNLVASEIYKTLTDKNK